ncbi:MAG: J domain-containing protein [Hydrogenophaga sp.]|uniref:J domain-containing protein n=1 Tax=Hydrogenophaga sp. TaxID=1904254 RepID=UPI0027172A66|nr:J domain-containing protein [Hydrogenophaga sp.]MDO9570017.1 J domain-containing protein [Hydrogenophaga sp.]MDP3372786.1 J domain-containing protein [Hydrogenophaga sp.]
MPSTTTRDTASAFRKKPVTFAPQAWSGRLDMAESSRPGGLLTAALMQCAAERDLSQSELATALGVSYWSLSQLRIGFRAIESLDEDVIQGCSALLDLPPLTIQALAGLLAPADVLACAELTAEDLLHARQMVRTEPADWVLLPPPNRARPLQALTVDELAELHREHADTPAVVALLRTELTSRPFSKTEQLRAAVARETVAQPEPEATPRPDAAPAPGILCCSRCQKRLRIPHLPEPSEIRCPSCRTEYTVHWQGLVCLVQALADTATGEDEDSEDRTEAVNEPATEPADAWAVLGLAPNSPWEQVERARRSLLQQYHPDRLGHVSPLVRQLAETAFKRVSDAYETLKAQR